MKKLFRNLRVRQRLLLTISIFTIFLSAIGFFALSTLNANIELTSEQRATDIVIRKLAKVRLFMSKNKVILTKAFLIEDTSEIVVLKNEYLLNYELLKLHIDRAEQYLDKLEVSREDQTLKENFWNRLMEIETLILHTLNHQSEEFLLRQFGIIRINTIALANKEAVIEDFAEDDTEIANAFAENIDTINIGEPDDGNLQSMNTTITNSILISKNLYKQVLHTSKNISRVLITTINAISNYEKTVAKRNTNSASRIRKIVIILIILFIFLAVSIIIVTAERIARPINLIRDYLRELSLGNLPDEFSNDSNDEIGQMIKSVNLLRRELDMTRKFAIEVGQGKFNTKINVFNSQGALGRALAEMRDGLYKVNREGEKQQFEEEQRNWATRGVAKFAEILRQNNDNLQLLTYNIIKNMVWYMDAVQGGLFLINDDGKQKKHIEQLSCFAYERKKSLKKVFKMNEGLIGRCIGENETIYLSDLPDSYITITSGLGDANPRSLLLVPLKINDITFGVMEIASFKPIEEYQINFVEKIGESIASSISSVKIAAQTTNLLNQAHENAEKMAAQEEELRQNIEEMQATQEEAARKESLASGFVNTVNHTLLRADFSVEGTLIYANSRFLEIVGSTSSEVEGRFAAEFLPEQDREEFTEMWKKLAQGGRHFEKIIPFQTTIGQYFLLTTFTAVRDQNGRVINVLFLAFDVDSHVKTQKKWRNEFENLLEEFVEVSEDVTNRWDKQLDTANKKNLAVATKKEENKN